MIVVADTSPINYLILIKEVDLLTKMYGTIVIPCAVRDELRRPTAPEAVQNWLGKSPSWLEIRTPVGAPDPALASLDLGERGAIMLAEELHANQLIVDDRRGRHEAQRRGIAVIGTLGVLWEASILGLLDLQAAIKMLQTTSFHIAPEVLARLLKDQR